jgi:phosphoribosylformimino-5-aminoimidazole carboxamide ribotide isomerase
VDLYPAIDLLGGRCVQLAQGDYSRLSVYSDDPVAVAESFAAAGAAWIHMVDLDAARTGVPGNREAVAAVVRAVDLPVQAGGGVRSATAARQLLDIGVARVVLGTAAVTEDGLVEALAQHHPGRVAVGLDHRRRGDGGREVAVRGWQEGSGLDLMEAVARFQGVGVAALVVTDISKDGMLEGPDLAGMGALLGATSVPLIASGGVSSLADVVALADLEGSGRTLSGAIVGTALYEGKLDLREAVAACAQ